MCNKMEVCEENLQKLENKEWVSFLQMGIIGQGDGEWPMKHHSRETIQKLIDFLTGQELARE